MPREIDIHMRRYSYLVVGLDPATLALAAALATS
jgi:hypothetical protein